MGDVINLIEKRLERCLLILDLRCREDRTLARGDYRKYAERELLLSQLIGLQTQNRCSDLNLFEEFALQTIEVNLGLKGKAVWPL